MPDTPEIDPLFATGSYDEFVAIDLETTGLNASTDRITEVGATRFTLEGETKSFSSFVNPGMPIPLMIQDLTGISEDDVGGAPTITSVGAELATFCGDRAVVGQNIRFDISFLHAAGVELAGASLDTLDLASVLLPTAARLDLATLAELLGVDPGTHHRALADAETARDVFLRLLTLIDRLPRTTLLDVLAFLQRGASALAPLFAAALSAADGQGGEGPSLSRVAARSAPQVLVPRESLRAVTAEDSARLFETATRQTELIEGFETRPGQVQMAQAVGRATVDSAHLAVEAGTGTGKSLAYLLPSLLHAYRNDDRVLVSTHTLNLQEQLTSHDIPAAARLVEQHEGGGEGTLRAAMLKGRGNYLCIERYAEAREEQRELTPPQARLLSRIATWLPQTETGDSGELYMPFDDRSAWDGLSADSNDCLARQCEYVREGSCFLVRARQDAAAAHVAVVNHALLMAASAGATQAVPPFRHLVIDEAHRLEEVATDQYGATLSLQELTALLRDFASSKGAAGRMRAAVRDGSPLSPAAGLAAIADTVASAAKSAIDRIEPLAEALRSYAEERRETGSDGGPDGELALGTARHSQPLWADVEETAMQLDVTLHYLGEQVAQARDAVSSMPDSAAPGLDRLRTDLGRESEFYARARETLLDVALRSDPGLIIWMRADDRDVRLSVAPLEVAGRLADNLYAACDSVVATSATLTTGGSFDYITEHLGLIEPDTLQVPSPFDYRKAVLAITVDDIPEPNSAGYGTEMHRALAAAARAADGRTLALFTSRNAVRAAAGALRETLAGDGITVLAQGIDGSPARLLRTLADRPRALVFGTAAFWEGIDVRGQALSQIVVARLPFPVPTDPIYAARAGQYEDPFNEYALPRAVLRFRQGFGRLIRGSDERGVFVVLDSRIATRRYGEAFVEGLPDCEVRRLPSSSLSQAVADWLA